MKSSKKKTFWKYLIGIGGIAVLSSAVVAGVVSCSNGSSSTSTPKTTSTQPAKPTTSKAPTQSSSTEPAYQLQTAPNTSTIAYKVNDTNSPTMLTTNVPNYNTLISEPNNVIISILGTPEAVINVAKDTNTKTAPNITLDLNQNSQLFADILKGTNNKADLATLNNLITFTTTTGTKDTFNLNNYEGKYVSTQDISLSNSKITYGSASANTVREIGVNVDGLFGLIPVDTFWSDLHPANNGIPSLIVTTTNYLFWNDKKHSETPFNVTINLLPLIKFSTQKTTLSLNSKNEYSFRGNEDGVIVSKDYPAWNLVVNNVAVTTSEFMYVNNTWYTNVPTDLEGLSITPISIPATSKNPSNLSSVPYIYVDNNMLMVGTTTPSSI